MSLITVFSKVSKDGWSVKDESLPGTLFLDKEFEKKWSRDDLLSLTMILIYIMLKNIGNINNFVLFLLTINSFRGKIFLGWVFCRNSLYNYLSKNAGSPTIFLYPIKKE
jgi:hypothetical protein